MTTIELPTNLVRPAFVQRMESELRANAAKKGDWHTWVPSPLTALAELQHHETKMIHAIEHGDAERVSEFAADIANIAMKIAEVFGSQNDGRLTAGPLKEGEKT